MLSKFNLTNLIKFVIIYVVKNTWKIYYWKRLILYDKLIRIIRTKDDRHKIFKISITPVSKEGGKVIADELRENNIATQTFPCFRNGEKVLGINVFAETKAQSAIVESVLTQHEGVKYDITTIKNRF